MAEKFYFVVKRGVLFFVLMFRCYNVAVFPRYKTSNVQPLFSEPLRRVVDIAGYVDIEFDKLASELLLTEDYARQVVFDVKVKEADTGRIENNTAVYTMFKYRHKLQLVKTAEAFKPGIPYVAYLKVNEQFHKFSRSSGQHAHILRRRYVHTKSSLCQEHFTLFCSFQQHFFLVFPTEGFFSGLGLRR